MLGTTLLHTAHAWHMNFHLSTPARLGVALAFAFFVLSLPYNFYHAPTLDLKPPHVASNRVSREILEAAGHAHQKGKDSNEAVNLNLGGKGPKGNEVNSNIGINSDATDGTAPFDMFAESISLMGAFQSRGRVDILATSGVSNLGQDDAAVLEISRLKI